jgi:hypothetical protein
MKPATQDDVTDCHMASKYELCNVYSALIYLFEKQNYV